MRAAGTSRLPPAWTPTTPLSAAIWAKPTMKRNARGWTSVSMPLPRNWTRKDPTPWFYDAIHETDHEPAGGGPAGPAKSHRAERQPGGLPLTAVARFGPGGPQCQPCAAIYTDLGFQQLALVEGWKSVNTDPSNFSAHRFLADSYLCCPATRSPGSVNCCSHSCCSPSTSRPFSPASPRATCSSSAPAVLGRSPSTSSIPFSTGMALPLQASGLGGENDTYAGEGVVSGIYKKASFSLGGSHFTTDGFRTKRRPKR